VGGMAVAASTIYCGSYILTNSWLLPYYRDAVQLYKNGFVTPMSANVFERAKKALADVEVSSKSKEIVKFFTVFGMDVFHAGSTKTVGGSLIGIPRHFNYQTVEDVERRDIVVEGNFVEWGSEGGQLLQDSLVLSENAQKFGIAREYCMSDSHYVYVKGLLPAGGIMSYFMLSRTANDMLYGLYKPRSFRILIYSGIGLFSYGLWAVSMDILTKYYENAADKRAGSISLDYARGGVEFYSKILQRNMGLRHVMGTTGEKHYTFFGNDVEYIRERHVPFTKRKSNLEKLAESLSETGGSTTTTQENGLS